MNRTALGFVVLTIACWATVGTAFKLTLKHIDALSLVFWASLFSVVVLTLLCFWGARFRQLKVWRLQDYGRSAMLGGINPVIYYLLLFKAYSLLPAQQAQVLNFAWPVVLTLLSVWFLKEEVSAKAWLAIAISFLGVVVIATKGEGFSFADSDPLGVSLALISTIVWASYWLINKTDSRDHLLRLWANFVAGTVVMAAVMTVNTAWQLPSREALLGAAYIGVIEMSLAFFFWLQALKQAQNTARLSNMIFITPFLSLCVIALVLKEAIHPSTVVGLCLIIAGIVWQRRLSR